MVDWATVVVSVGTSVGGSLLVNEIRLRRERSMEQDAEIEQWYETSGGYASQVRRTWDRLFDVPDHQKNFSELEGELSLLEGQISRHASEGEQLGVEQGAIDALDKLAMECRKASEATYGTNAISIFQEHKEDILSAVDKVEKEIDEKV